MINDFTALAQIGGTLATVVLFLRYLQKKDEETKNTYDAFNKMINNHLHTSDVIIKKNTTALNNVSSNLKNLSSLISDKK